MKNFKFSSSANGKVFRNGLYSTAILAAAIVLAVLINLLVGAIPKKYTEFDLSAAKMYTLGDSSRQLMQSLDQDVTVYYLCETGSEDAIITKLLDHYADESGHFHWEQKDPALYPTFAAQYGAENASTGSLIVVSGENSEVLNAAELYEYDYSDYYTTGAANVTFGGEKQISSAIYKLTAAAESHAYYTTNHGEQALTSSLTEALKAQAVCARTYAVCQTKHRAQGFDICATTHCQVYQGTAASGANSDAAVDQTAGEFLYYSGRLVQEAVYYSSNGGASEDSLNVWGNDVGYLKGKIDPYEGKIASIIPRYNWSTTFTASELTTLLNNRGYGIGTVKNAYVSAYTDTGNVYSITFTGTSGSKTIVREACRSLLNLRSQRFTIGGGGSENAYSVNDTGESVALSAASAVDSSGKRSALSGNVYVITSSGTSQLEQRTTTSGSGSFVISGSGYGHNVGMSQWGAYSMANLGYSYRDILQFYYTDVSIR